VGWIATYVLRILTLGNSNMADVSLPYRPSAAQRETAIGHSQAHGRDKKTTNTSLVSQWLLPHMTERAFKSDEVLFRKGDATNSMIYVASGEMRTNGLNETLGP
jgi:CRP-like cAMP-binding protein